ncbi:hypothetical protein ALP78_01754 [Pseudomonas coronafaciens pv. striafaciens]|uniref:Uncharacterized protein n=1 Tax=Pseudomonas coronafaciens pv. striafaciens TaxID=235276 RepID=A0A3M4Y3G6_9PSED|nr:hypothetical protein ALP78_01754 [Pseudomonas coronafaciens pv. striafaciens]
MDGGSGTVLQGIELMIFGIPDQRLRPVVDLRCQRVERFVHRNRLGTFKTVERLGRALEVVRLATVDLAAAAQPFIDQAGLDAVSQ